MQPWPKSKRLVAAVAGEVAVVPVTVAIAVALAIATVAVALIAGAVAIAVAFNEATEVENGALEAKNGVTEIENSAHAGSRSRHIKLNQQRLRITTNPSTVLLIFLLLGHGCILVWSFGGDFSGCNHRINFILWLDPFFWRFRGMFFSMFEFLGSFRGLFLTLSLWFFGV